MIWSPPLEHLGWLLLAVAAAYGCAAAAPLSRSWSRNRLALAAGWWPVPAVLACPLLIPSEGVAMRAASAFLSTDLMFKMVDFFRHSRRAPRGTDLREYYRFLIPFPVLSVVYPDHNRRLPRPESPWPSVLRVLGGSVGFALGVVMLATLADNATLRSNFLLDHTVKLFVFVVSIESLSRLLCGLERLAGFDTTPFVRDAYLSRTVAEFWRRYNNRVHAWFLRNVFRPAGGRHSPTRAVVSVFFVSGLFHELMFGIATSRFNGYQFAFFMLQAPAALASGRLERLARRGGVAGKVVAHGSAILFLAVTSVLFFHGVDMVFPTLYTSTSPLP